MIKLTPGWPSFSSDRSQTQAASWASISTTRPRRRSDSSNQRKIAVASFFVSGPGALDFREDELATLQADVELGMTLLNNFAPLQDLRFAYVIEAAQSK